MQYKGLPFEDVSTAVRTCGCLLPSLAKLRPMKLSDLNVCHCLTSVPVPIFLFVSRLCYFCKILRHTAAFLTGLECSKW